MGCLSIGRTPPSLLPDHGSHPQNLEPPPPLGWDPRLVLVFLVSSCLILSSLGLLLFFPPLALSSLSSSLSLSQHIDLLHCTNLISSVFFLFHCLSLQLFPSKEGHAASSAALSTTGLSFQHHITRPIGPSHPLDRLEKKPRPSLISGLVARPITTPSLSTSTTHTTPTNDQTPARWNFTGVKATRCPFTSFLSRLILGHLCACLHCLAINL